MLVVGIALVVAGTALVASWIGPLEQATARPSGTARAGRPRRTEPPERRPVGVRRRRVRVRSRRRRRGRGEPTARGGDDPSPPAWSRRDERRGSVRRRGRSSPRAPPATADGRVQSRGGRRAGEGPTRPGADRSRRAAVVLLLRRRVTWWVVGRALAPVEAIRAEVDAMSATELHRRVPAGRPATRSPLARR